MMAGTALTRLTSGAEVAYPGLALGRPHTDFIQSQVAPGRVLGANNSQPGVEGSALSYDAGGTRAVTVLFRYPPGWLFDRPHYVNSDQEFLVLEGRVEFDGIVYESGDYAYLPAGQHHRSMSSPSGATLLNFYEGEHLAKYEETPAGLYEPGKLIERRASRAMPWTSVKDAGLAALGRNVRSRVLRSDPTTGEGTWLVKVDADGAAAHPLLRPTATHAAVEEMYVLEGRIASPRGTLSSGGYVWRAPGVARGPYGTTTGYVALLRSKGGALRTTLSKHPAEVLWNAPYDPVIAEPMRAFAFSTFDPAKRY